RAARLGGAAGIARHCCLRAVRRLLPAPRFRRVPAMACLGGNADITSAMGRVWLSVASRSQCDRAITIRTRRRVSSGLANATDRPEGFGEDDLTLLRAVLPALSLAMMTHAGHTIASGLLEAYLGGDAGRRVHAGAVERGSVESIRAVLWFADMRGFTKLADSS